MSQQIVHFVGKVLGSREEVVEAPQAREHGDYVIISDTVRLEQKGLDYFKMTSRNQSFASMANSSDMCKNVKRNTFPSANVKRSCKRMGNGVYIFGLIYAAFYGNLS